MVCVCSYVWEHAKSILLTPDLEEMWGRIQGRLHDMHSDGKAHVLEREEGKAAWEEAMEVLREIPARVVEAAETYGRDELAEGAPAVLVEWERKVWAEELRDKKRNNHSEL
eukprot:TRINITY_DN12783_c0_g1_i2.p4 TRINITY_DN12783_c0_g1~~TRINITY_DN12783_c0_g1_i2.p4  ORF type:complete len:111 (-),score=31.77 TRINITY_DN12783_c0_g1_i2:218-550(-)